ncbi:MAG TPA: hypothetical protein VF307_05840, partial [Candidatus Nanopelagicaceae bacterium]
MARYVVVSILLTASVITSFFKFGHGTQKSSHSGPITTIKGPVERTLFSNVQVAAVMQNGRLI